MSEYIDESVIEAGYAAILGHVRVSMMMHSAVRAAALTERARIRQFVSELDGFDVDRRTIVELLDVIDNGTMDGAPPRS